MKIREARKGVVALERKLGGKVRLEYTPKDASKEEGYLEAESQREDPLLEDWREGKGISRCVRAVYLAAKNNIGLAASETDPVVRANRIAITRIRSRRFFFQGFGREGRGE